MSRQQPAISIPRRPLLRQLDYLPPWLAVALGLMLGGGLGVGLALAEPLVLVVGGATLLVGAVALAWSGEPVAELLESPAARQTEPTVKAITPSTGHIVVTGNAPTIRVGPPPPPLPLPEMVTIPAGVFRIGSPKDEWGRYDDEGPVHEVHISTFECMRYLVTRRLYKAVMENDPGWPKGDADERPVNNVSWLDAVRFCNRLSELTGLTPCYVIDAENNVRWEDTADGYRLLTEAEWEYACRAGSQGRWCFGDDEPLLEQYAWYDKNSKDQPQSVGQKLPNDWGLYDMHGNVWECCWDWYGPYPGASQYDRMGPPQGDRRVRRGGAFINPAGSLCSAFRNWVWTEDRGRVIGLRCARSPRRQQ